MAKPLIQFLAETSGDCCIYNFLQRYRGMKNKDMAAKLGVSLRLVVKERGIMKDGGYACRHRENCKCQKPK